MIAYNVGMHCGICCVSTATHRNASYHITFELGYYVKVVIVEVVIVELGQNQHQ